MLIKTLLGVALLEPRGPIYKAYDDIVGDYSQKKTISQIRGYQAKHFHFNVDGGRCETCKGEGPINV
jgi:excinuclease ABC subunit A